MTAANAIRQAPEFQALIRLSAALGADPEVIQGAGGNTSLKADGVLWIKASGTWLMHAASRDIMVPVALAPLLVAVACNDPRADSAQAFVIAADNPSGLRPSIETTVHGSMPQTVVVHVHCVDTIAWAAQVDAEAQLRARLDGVAWAYVPYVQPGLSLAQAIARAKRPDTNVLVLGNHGLVVAADTVAAASALLDDVRRRLARPVRAAPPADLDRLAEIAAGSAYRLPVHIAAHALGADPVSGGIAAGGSLYPDHVIFLDPVTAVLRPGETLADAVARASGNGPAPRMLIVPGAGVLLHQDTSAGADEMARCLALVAARLTPSDRLRFLAGPEIDQLTHWDAEQYRQKMSATPAVAG